MSGATASDINVLTYSPSGIFQEKVQTSVHVWKQLYHNRILSYLPSVALIPVFVFIGAGVIGAGVIFQGCEFCKHNYIGLHRAGRGPKGSQANQTKTGCIDGAAVPQERTRKKPYMLFKIMLDYYGLFHNNERIVKPSKKNRAYWDFD